MTKINDGGPAFPGRVSANRDTGELHPHQFGNDDFCVTGMTLRDFFAAEVAVQDADITVPYGEAVVGREMPDYARDPVANAVFWADVRARLRYIEADAMLRARGTQ